MFNPFKKNTVEKLSGEDLAKIVQGMKKLVEEEFKRVNFEDFMQKISSMMQMQNEMLKRMSAETELKISKIETAIRAIEKELDITPSYIG